MARPLNFFYFVPSLKNKFFINDFKILLNYVVGWQSHSFLTGLLQYLAKNMALLVPTYWGEFFCQNPFSAILRLKKGKKVLMATKLVGEGGLSRATKK